MNSTQYGLKLLLSGDGEIPPLSADWKTEVRGLHLIAIAPDGTEHFIENQPDKFVLHRRLIAGDGDVQRTGGRLKLGEPFLGEMFIEYPKHQTLVA